MYKRIDRIYKEISKKEARELIYEARYFSATNGNPEEVIAYERIDGLLHSLFSIRDYLPYDIKYWDEDMLLIYVRSRIPKELTFS
jgi:hypothetical protein